MKDKHDLPTSCIKLVASFCADYERMKKALRSEREDKRKLTLLTYTYTIYTEVEDATGLKGVYVDMMILAIGANQGYKHSELSALMTIGQYYRRKKKAIRQIAKALYLI